MIKNFTLRKRGDLHILKRNSYPRFNMTVDLKKLIPEITFIRFQDKCPASQMAQTIYDVGIYLETFNLDSEE